MTFEDLNLNKPLLNALEDLGVSTPTTIQEKAFSVVMSGQDVCGIAQTGTGKTFAYLLPCLRLWSFAKERYPQVLILVPTRELVEQVTTAVQQLTKYMSVETAGFYGGVNMKGQMAAADGKIDIVVATPGRLVDLILSGALKMKNIKRLVIDEVDEMLNLGFRPQLTRVLDMLPVRRQNLMFSATMTPEVDAIIHDFFHNPTVIEAAPAGTPLANIRQTVYHVPNFNTKVNLLEYLLLNRPDMSKVLVFASTKALADELYEKMAEHMPGAVGVIHSNKDQNFRFNSVRQFREGVFRVLIATDIMARGLDIAEVSHVINFDMPESPENYIHRIGRTGRKDAEGNALTFVTEKEMPLLRQAEALMKFEVPEEAIPAEVEISTVLIKSEIPEVIVPNIKLKLRSTTEGGGAFHEKLEKNKKVNVKISHKEKMQLKYGKPKKRPKKR
ncbi:DEAD/DEAH box helicase [Chitinophaga caseinilytica]|uniref:DEAD/DEAH box helicase n=1 Tax=Chitinophaga caseinilytica TaxID=2267521 RepID=A0ABZ2Z9Q7_9BACT